MTVQVKPLTISRMSKDAYLNAVDKGFHHNEDGSEDDIGIPGRLALVHSEVSEALEEDRKGHAPGYIYYRESDGKPEGFLAELADVVIRIGDMVGKYGLEDEFESMVGKKMAFNTTRPYRHGKKY